MLFTPEDPSAPPPKKPRGRRGGRKRRETASAQLRAGINEKATHRSRVWTGHRNGDTRELSRELADDFEALRRQEAGAHDGRT